MTDKQSGARLGVCKYRHEKVVQKEHCVQIFDALHKRVSNLRGEVLYSSPEAK